MKNSLLKKLAGSLAITLLSIPSFGQIEFSGGLLGGVSLGNVKIQDMGSAFSDDAKGTNIVGFEVGPYAKLLINPFYVKPSVLYDHRSGDVEYHDISGSHTASFSVNKIQVPVMLGFHIIGPLNIEAGPVYNYLITVTDHYNSTDVSLGKNGLGYRFGVMAEFGGLILGASYQGAAYTNGSDRASFSEPYKLVLNLGIRFGSTGKDNSDNNNSNN